MTSDRKNVFVAAPAHVHNEEIVRRQGGRELGHVSKRMGRLQRRDYAFQTRAELKGIERLAVGCIDISHAASIAEPRVLRANPRVIEACRDGMSIEDLAVVILEQVSPVSMQ